MKYTPAEVRLIRKYAVTHTAQQIGEMLGRSRYSVIQKARSEGISMIKHGETHYNVKYTDHDVELCRALHDEGLSQTEIAKKMEIPRPYVCKMVNHIVRKPA